LLLPLCELTNAIQGDQILLPLLIPTLLDTFDKIHPMSHFQGVIDYLIEEFLKMFEGNIKDKEIRAPKSHDLISDMSDI